MKNLMALSELSPFSAHLCLDIERFFLSKLHLEKGLSLLLAVSGGAEEGQARLLL